jgi:hypothetical protein
MGHNPQFNPQSENNGYCLLNSFKALPPSCLHFGPAGKAAASKIAALYSGSFRKNTCEFSKACPRFCFFR